MKAALHFHFIAGSYIGCSLMLIVAFMVIYDFYDEMSDFYQEIDKELRTFEKYADDVRRSMTMRSAMSEMTERDVFEALIRIVRGVEDPRQEGGTSTSIPYNALRRTNVVHRISANSSIEWLSC